MGTVQVPQTSSEVTSPASVRAAVRTGSLGGVQRYVASGISPSPRILTPELRGRMQTWAPGCPSTKTHRAASSRNWHWLWRSGRFRGT